MILMEKKPTNGGQFPFGAAPAFFLSITSSSMYRLSHTHTHLDHACVIGYVWRQSLKKFQSDSSWAPLWPLFIANNLFVRVWQLEKSRAAPSTHTKLNTHLLPIWTKDETSLLFYSIWYLVNIYFRYYHSVECKMVVPNYLLLENIY